MKTSSFALRVMRRVSAIRLKASHVIVIKNVIFIVWLIFIDESSKKPRLVKLLIVLLLFFYFDIFSMNP